MYWKFHFIMEFPFFLCYNNIIVNGGNMKIETGYLYHIKDEFFDKININGVMINHENGRSRPTYFTIRERDILWFIPLSSNISKY